MKEIEEYFNELIKKYNCNIKFCTDNICSEKLEKIPNCMYDFYRMIEKADLPYGEIFSMERAIKESERLPFKPNWFVFGKDNYFSFWLCLYSPDSEGMSFTSWDHEGGSEIGEAADKDICSFLKDEEEEYDSNEKL